MTLTYSLDSNATPNPNGTSFASEYALHDAQISFSSGYSSDLPGSNLFAWASDDRSQPGNFTLSYELRGPSIYYGDVGAKSAYTASDRSLGTLRSLHRTSLSSQKHERAHK